jgi:dienelactone hydrolase
MKKILLITICIITLSDISCKKSSSIPVTSERYKDELFSGVTKSTIQFDQQPDYQGNPVILYADLYQPTGDNSTSRAAIIFVHGGGFTGGTRDGGNVPYLCEELARRGYVAASIDYRVGVADTTSTAKGKAQIRAIQDLKSFIRFAKANATTTKIDATRIFISGSSAGGGTVLATAYMDYAERPLYMDTTSVGSLEGKGNLNGNNASVKAVYSMWGAMGDTSWIKPGDIPVACIQSMNDPCIAWNYMSSTCNTPGYGSYGSNSINIRAKSLGIQSALYGFNSDVHDLGMTFPYIDTTIAQMSNFLYPLAK